VTDSANYASTVADAQSANSTIHDMSADCTEDKSMGVPIVLSGNAITVGGTGASVADRQNGDAASYKTSCVPVLIPGRTVAGIYCFMAVIRTWLDTRHNDYVTISEGRLHKLPGFLILCCLI